MQNLPKEGCCTNGGNTWRPKINAAHVIGQEYRSGSSWSDFERLRIQIIWLFDCYPLSQIEALLKDIGFERVIIDERSVLKTPRNTLRIERYGQSVPPSARRLLSTVLSTGDQDPFATVMLHGLM